MQNLTLNRVVLFIFLKSFTVTSKFEVNVSPNQFDGDWSRDDAEDVADRRPNDHFTGLCPLRYSESFKRLASIAPTLCFKAGARN